MNINGYLLAVESAKRTLQYLRNSAKRTRTQQAVHSDEVCKRTGGVHVLGERRIRPYKHSPSKAAPHTLSERCIRVCRL